MHGLQDGGTIETVSIYDACGVGLAGGTENGDS